MYCGVCCGNPGWQVDSRFVAHLRSFFVIPPLWSDAEGRVKLHWQDNRSVNYKVFIQNLCGIIGVTINLGKFGRKGHVVAVLFDSRRHGVCSDGLLCKGTLHNADLTGPLKGKPISCLVEQMRFGNTHVTVYTKDHPHSALRGQIFMSDTKVKKFPPLWLPGCGE